MRLVLFLISLLFLTMCSDGYEISGGAKKCPEPKCKKCPPCPKPEPTPTPTPTPTPNECDSVKDECPVKYGVKWNCKQRFVFGANYAWHDFGTDFGGLKYWQQNGVLANSAAIDAELADMKSVGVNVVRWWIMPDFRSDAVLFDSTDTPTGINSSSSFFADITEAMRLVEKHDMYVMFVIFSYDNFKVTKEVSGVKIRSITPIATDQVKRKSLVENIIRPLAKHVGKSLFSKRVIAWDLVNEPEWAMTGKSKYGDPDYECNQGKNCITHEQIEVFLKDVVAVLRAETKSLITVGASAMKWRYAWHGLGLDFYQYHIYDWIQDWWPYNKTPTQYGVGDKPVVMGEYPMNGLKQVTNAVLLPGLYQYQYAGALGWSVTDKQFGWEENKKDLAEFSSAKSCETTF